MEIKCSTCKYYTEGVTNEQRHRWESSNFGRWASGVCHLDFPRGYIARKAPHPAMGTGKCFQYVMNDEITGKAGEKEKREYEE